MTTKKKTTRKKSEKPKLILLEPGTKFPECLTEEELGPVKMVPLPAKPIDKFPPSFGSDVTDDWMHTAARQSINNDPEGIPDTWLTEGNNAPIPAPRQSLILPPDYMADAPIMMRPTANVQKPMHPKLRPLPNEMRAPPPQEMMYQPAQNLEPEAPHPVYENPKPSKTVKKKTKPTGIDYKFNEDGLVAEIAEYLDSTYLQHYANSGNYQAMDIIIDAGHGMGFTLGNVIKYNKRYGKKEGYNRKDLLKMIHYAILALYVHDYNVKAAQELDE